MAFNTMPAMCTAPGSNISIPWLPGGIHVPIYRFALPVAPPLPPLPPMEVKKVVVTNTSVTAADGSTTHTQQQTTTYRPAAAVVVKRTPPAFRQAGINRTAYKRRGRFTDRRKKHAAAAPVPTGTTTQHFVAPLTGVKVYHGRGKAPTDSDDDTDTDSDCEITHVNLTPKAFAAAAGITAMSDDA